MCHCDWLNKELNSQYQGRKRVGRTSGQREGGGGMNLGAGESPGYTEENRMCNGREIKGHEAKCRLIEMVNLSYKC